MKSVKDLLKKWLEDNPDGWKDTDRFISEQVDVSIGSVSRYVPEIIADRDGIMPSEVQELRREKGKVSSRRPKADPDRIRKIIDANPNAPICDLAFLANCSHGAIKRVLKTIGQQPDRNREMDKNKIQEIIIQLEQIQSQIEQLRVSLSQSQLDE